MRGVSIRITQAVLLIGFLFSSVSTRAHEIPLALLKVTESSPGTFELLFKPNSKVPKVENPLRVPATCSLTVPSNMRTTAPNVRFWNLACKESEKSQRLTLHPNLQETLHSIILHLTPYDEETRTQYLSPDQSIPLNSQPGLNPRNQNSGALDYIYSGLSHLLFGFDHLLFVLGLFLLFASKRKLLVGITFFTLGHTASLLLWVSKTVVLPSGPTEFLIAASLVLLAREATPARRSSTSLVVKHPSAITLVFGLLHGQGFANALSLLESGVQPDLISVLFFNLGIEMGQVVFLAALFLLKEASQRFSSIQNTLWTQTSPYIIGTIGVFWCLERF